mgnify:FL=1
MGLLVHCGANLVEREQVMMHPAPDPTDTWHPITHGALLDEVTNSLQLAGLTITEEAHAMTPNGNRYFGLLQIQGKDDFAAVIGARNSHDKSFGAQIVLGASVFVCDNLSFNGEIKIARRHTLNIMQDLPGLVYDAVLETTRYIDVQAQQYTTYKETEITERMAEHAIVEMVRRNIVNTQRVVKVVKEWDAPRHPEFAEARNVWRLFNAVTEINKGVQLANPNKDFHLHTLMGELIEEAA